MNNILIHFVVYQDQFRQEFLLSKRQRKEPEIFSSEIQCPRIIDMDYLHTSIFKMGPYSNYFYYWTHQMCTFLGKIFANIWRVSDNQRFTSKKVLMGYLEKIPFQKTVSDISQMYNSNYRFGITCLIMLDFTSVLSLPIYMWIYLFVWDFFLSSVTSLFLVLIFVFQNIVGVCKDKICQNAYRWSSYQIFDTVSWPFKSFVPICLNNSKSKTSIK